MKFDGKTYNPKRDKTRLSSQLSRVKRVMMGGAWLTIPAIRERIALPNVTDSEAGISARIRDLRKSRFGGHEVQRKRLVGGSFAYRVAKIAIVILAATITGCATGPAPNGYFDIPIPDWATGDVSPAEEGAE